MMVKRVLVVRRWTGKVPIGRDRQPIPKVLWPKRRGSVWLVRWFAPGPDGTLKRPSRRFRTREAAEAFKTKLQAQFNVAPATRREPRKLTLGQFIDEFLALGIGPAGQKYKPRSLHQTKLALNHFAAAVGRDRPLANISPQHVARYFAGLREKGGRGSGPATINCRLRMLRSALAVAISPLELIRENPFKGFKAERTTDGAIRYVNAEEFTALLRACDDEARPTWWRAFLKLAYSGGLRFSELLNLVWSDIDFASGVVHVTPKAETRHTVPWTAKDFERRTIPLPAESLDELTKLQQEAADGQTYVFISPERVAFIKAAIASRTWSACRYIQNNCHRRFPRIVKRAAETAPTLLDGDGKPTVSLHDLRRSAITNWSKVANVQTVARLAGHNDLSTTMRYYAAVTDDQIEAVRAANAAAMAAVSRTTDPKLTPPGGFEASATNTPNRKV